MNMNKSVYDNRHHSADKFARPIDKSLMNVSRYSIPKEKVVANSVEKEVDKVDKVENKEGKNDN